LRERTNSLAETVGVPRDPRGIVLACGFIGVAAVGIGSLLPPSDPIGIAYLAAALIGLFFLQTRFLPAFLWALIAAYGLLGGLAGAPGGWVEAGLGALLALVAVFPLPASEKMRPAVGGPEATNGVATVQPTVNPSSVDAELPQPELSPTSAAVEEAVHDVRAQAGPPNRPRITTLGAFEIASPDGEVGGALRDKAVLHFLFDYLTARWVLAEPRVERSSLADELSPKWPAKSQRDRLRKQLYDLQKDTGPVISALVHTNRTHVWLDLNEVDADVRDLRTLADEAEATNYVISPALAAEMSDVLERTKGEFLTGFEELEKKVTESRGTAADTVSDARLRIAQQRADLARAVAEYADAIGRPDDAITHLRAALDAVPDRQDVARLLSIAYLKTGQPARASQVRRQFALKE
jgi:DNA-binding SARP family transcriptional activator